ncbi:hypothetical protein EVG20_g8537 [Dentipellis fragilis]|uniref:BAR domain-containing protein n=1 Tax=Dentipellis fragilis TaxID=205917 RepID=A0A4Y9Y5N8_9AGAM|nr:hypothetical protein EVG20_g8537 [Dentipellis fragilis]
MDGWNKLSSSIASLNLGQSANKFAKGFNSSVQATKERLGQVSADEITELPQEYKALEERVDALRQTHLAILKITRVYETEAYDYPTQVQESLSEFGHEPAHPEPLRPAGASAQDAPARPRTRRPRAAATVHAASGQSDDSKLERALVEYAGAWEKIGEARVVQDETIRTNFLAPWQQTLQTSIAVAMKARQAVRVSRLELDAAKQTLKNANPAKQEHARLEVENAEDDLVQKTEVAITLMKAVLDNPEPLKNLNDLTKAQLSFHAAAAEALSSVQGEIEELSVAAEGEYRKSRDH